MNDLREEVEKNRFKYEFSYEVSIKEETKVFEGEEIKDMIKFPKIEKDDSIFLLKDLELFGGEFSFLIIKSDKIILFQYAKIPWGF